MANSAAELVQCIRRRLLLCKPQGKGIEMGKKLKIVIACGSGVATSTLASKGVREVCDDLEIDVSIDTCGMAEVEQLAHDADIVFTTNRCDKELRCPVESIIAFVTGIRVKATKEKIGKMLVELSS